MNRLRGTSAIANLQETALTLTNEHGTYSISVPCGDMDMDEMVNMLIRPVLLAAGYAPKTVNDAIGE